MTDGKTTEAVRYTFTRSELYELGQQLARQAAEVFELDCAKKETAKSLGAQIEHTNNQVAASAAKINAGYEMRDVECLILLDSPRPGMKAIIRQDTQETVREELMTKDEMQRPLPFGKPPAPSDDKPN